MSYCDPPWISDYHFAKALEHRIADASAAHATAASGGAQRSTLLLWGGVTPEGELHLDPAFVMDAPVKLPSGPGPYRIEGIGDGGRGLFALDAASRRIESGVATGAMQSRSTAFANCSASNSPCRCLAAKALVASAKRRSGARSVTSVSSSVADSSERCSATSH